MSPYLDRLATRTTQVETCLCLGIDPDPAALPAGFGADIGGVEAFARVLLATAARHAAAVKVNLAFFEAFGSAGLAALERLRTDVPADLPFIADAKRGDIGSTAARQAVAVLDVLQADAVTASPYLGRDALAPFLEREDRFLYVLCRTSNSGAAEVQDLALIDGSPLYLAVARRATEWARTWPRLGLVVGATAPAELATVRRAAPDLPFLVPGAGAQGGDVAAALADGQARNGRRGGSLLVNVSRAIASAVPDGGRGEGIEEALDRTAADWAQRLRC